MQVGLLQYCWTRHCSESKTSSVHGSLSLVRQWNLHTRETNFEAPQRLRKAAGDLSGTKQRGAERNITYQCQSIVAENAFASSNALRVTLLAAPRCDGNLKETKQCLLEECSGKQVREVKSKLLPSASGKPGSSVWQHRISGDWLTYWAVWDLLMTRTAFSHNGPHGRVAQMLAVGALVRVFRHQATPTSTFFFGGEELVSRNHHLVWSSLVTLADAPGTPCFWVVSAHPNQRGPHLETGNRKFLSVPGQQTRLREIIAMNGPFGKACAGRRAAAFRKRRKRLFVCCLFFTC